MFKIRYLYNICYLFIISRIVLTMDCALNISLIISVVFAGIALGSISKAKSFPLTLATRDLISNFLCEF